MKFIRKIHFSVLLFVVIALPLLIALIAGNKYEVFVSSPPHDSFPEACFDYPNSDGCLACFYDNTQYENLCEECFIAISSDQTLPSKCTEARIDWSIYAQDEPVIDLDLSFGEVIFYTLLCSLSSLELLSILLLSIKVIDQLSRKKK